MEKMTSISLNGLAGPHPPFNGKVHKVTEEIFLNPSLRRVRLVLAISSYNTQLDSVVTNLLSAPGRPGPSSSDDHHGDNKVTARPLTPHPGGGWLTLFAALCFFI